MADDDKIVQEIEIGGADESVDAFTKIGDAAEEGLGKIDKAAATASAALERFSTQLDATTKKTAESSKNAGEGATGLGKLESAASQLGSSLRDVGSAAGNFASRVGVIGTAAIAAVGGVILLSKALLSQVNAGDEAGKSSRELRQEVKASSAIFTDQQTRAVANARAFSELNHQLVTGKVTGAEYVAQMIELQRTQKNEAEDAIRVAIIQEEATKRRLEEVKALEKEQEKRKALNELVKKFGSDLTNSLLRLGQTSEDFWREFVSGPSVAARAVDAINDVLDKAGSKFIGFFNRITAAIAKAFNFKDGQKGIDEFGEKLVHFGEEVTTIFETIIAPAIKKFLDIVGLIADAINGIFGTNFSAGGLLFLVLIVKLTGGFTLLGVAIGAARTALLLFWAAVTRNPIGLIITALALLAVYLATKVDWKAFLSKAQDAARSIAKAWEDFKQFFVDLWEKTKQTASDAWEWVKQKAADAWQFVVDKWNSFLQFFVDLWEGIKQKASDAWDFIVDKFDKGVASIVAFFQPVIDKLNAVWDLAKKAGAAIASAFNQGPQGKGDSSGDDGGFAGGGAVRGPGTSTSDSIWARLSTGEFVMKAAAVQRYGVSWMHAVNQMRAPKFNMGGLVEMLQQPMVPQFAGGGHVSQAGTGRPIVLNIGGESFHLMTRDGDTAEQIGRFATKRRMVRTGRMPSHFGA